MKHEGLYALFLTELADMHSAETQMVESLPHLIKTAASSELKEALTHHLKETKHQVERLNQIFSLLGLKPETKLCKAMKGILSEVDGLVADQAKGPTLDAAIISGAQKVEHYEIASYGALRSFAKHLDFDSEITDLLQANLDEEGAADKKLTKIADGSIFSSGVNREAAQALASPRSKK